MSEEDLRLAIVNRLLGPIAGQSSPCGAPLEDDPALSALERASEGKPESQWASAEPPNWRDVRTQAEELLTKSKHLGVAVLWARAIVQTEGFSALPSALHLIHGLLERYWDTLHPLPDPDDGDLYGRRNALLQLPDAAGLLGDVRQTFVFRERGIGEIKVRSLEIVAGILSAKPDDAAPTKGEVASMFDAALARDPALGITVLDAFTQAQTLAKLIDDRFTRASSVDLKPLIKCISVVKDWIPSVAQPSDAPTHSAPEAATGSPQSRSTPSSPLTGVNSRAEAVRAIDLVCEFLERTEPTNPAPLFLRRARKLINHSFLQLMKELAPDALAEVARVMGVDPESVQLDDVE